MGPSLIEVTLGEFSDGSHDPGHAPRNFFAATHPRRLGHLRTVTPQNPSPGFVVQSPESPPLSRAFVAVHEDIDRAIAGIGSRPRDAARAMGLNRVAWSIASV